MNLGEDSDFAMTIWRFWISEFCVLCVCVCVCVREREREREREGHSTSAVLIAAFVQRLNHCVCHATLFPFWAWTDGKTRDIINCLYFYFYDYGKGRSGPSFGSFKNADHIYFALAWSCCFTIHELHLRITVKCCKYFSSLAHANLIYTYVHFHKSYLCACKSLRRQIAFIALHFRRVLGVFGQSQCIGSVGQSEQTALVRRRDFVENEAFERGWA